MIDSKRERIQQTLLDRLTCDIQFVIITPIASAFNKLNEMLAATNHCKRCFFHNALVHTKNGLTGLIVCIPQGLCSQDVMFAFSGVQVVFYGYAGGLHEDMGIGSIFEVETTITPAGEVFSLNTVSGFRTATCGYSPCLLGDIASQHCMKARSVGCHVVDMEVAYCARAANINLNHLTAFLIISDLPGRINFWDLSERNKVYFKQNSKKAMEYIASYVHSIPCQ